MKIRKERTADHQKKVLKNFGVDLLFVLPGCALSAFATIGIMLRNDLTSGGISGMIRILQQFVAIDFSVLYYGATILVFVTAILVLGWREARKILLMTLLYPPILILFEQLNLALLEEEDIFLAAIYVGVIWGIASGLIYTRGYSFGGTDTIAKMIRKKLLPHVSQPKILLLIDGVVISGSAFVFGRNIALYALITQVILTKTIEFVMYGINPQMVQVEIITSHHDEVASYILNEVERGVTNVSVVGEFTGVTRDKIVTLCTPRESILIKNHVAKTDRNAFVTVIHVDTVWGKGTGFQNLVE